MSVTTHFLSVRATFIDSFAIIVYQSKSKAVLFAATWNEDCLYWSQVRYLVEVKCPFINWMTGQEDAWGTTWTGLVSFKRPWLVGCQGQSRCCGEGRILNARFDVFMSVLLQIPVLWDVMLCGWVSSSWRKESVVSSSSGSKQYKTSALKLKALWSFETSGITCQTSGITWQTQHHIPGDWNLKMFQVLQRPLGLQVLSKFGGGC